MSDLTSPLASYDLPGFCLSGLIAHNYLIIGVGFFNYVIVYELSASLTEPLKQIARIETIKEISKIMDYGQCLFLGEKEAFL